MHRLLEAMDDARRMPGRGDEDEDGTTCPTTMGAYSTGKDVNDYYDAGRSPSLSPSPPPSIPPPPLPFHLEQWNLWGGG